jgi:hypothetical protein
MYGLVDEPVPENAVREIVLSDERVSRLLHEISAAAATRQFAEVVTLAGTTTLEFSESPLVATTAAQSLISGGLTSEALAIIHAAQKLFPSSVRLQQLEGLAYRRAGRTLDAQKVLSKLHVEGHRDPETMGIYAATWMQRYQQSKDRADLEYSRSLYLDAFKASPKDEYVGINAASKSAILGELELSREIAKKVEALVSKFADGSKFYESLSLAEANLLLGRYDEAARVYQETRVRNPGKAGDLVTSIEQVNALVVALQIPDDVAQRLRSALGAA